MGDTDSPDFNKAMGFLIVIPRSGADRAAAQAVADTNAESLAVHIKTCMFEGVKNIIRDG